MAWLVHYAEKELYSCHFDTVTEARNYMNTITEKCFPDGIVVLKDDMYIKIIDRESDLPYIWRVIRDGNYLVTFKHGGIYPMETENPVSTMRTSFANAIKDPELNLLESSMGKTEARIETADGELTLMLCLESSVAERQRIAKEILDDMRRDLESGFIDDNLVSVTYNGNTVNFEASDPEIFGNLELLLEQL